jgi:beta-lactamase family protein
MTQTSTRQPLPVNLRKDMSNGFLWGGGGYTSKPFEIITGAAPAGSMSASATDMAKFMIAHLNNGAFNGQRILAESTAVKMHARAFGHDQRLPGFALGFYEKSSHGLRIIGHGGDTQWFHTDLALIPAERVGVFVSFNTQTGGELSFGPFLTRFLDHYYPTTPTPVTLSPDGAKAASRVAGEYEFNRRSYTTFQKALGLASVIRVSPTDSGRVILKSPLGDTRLVPVGPLLYREELGENLVAFKEDGSGHVAMGFLGIAPMMTMDRVPWWSSPPLHWVVLGLGILVFVATIVAALRRFVRRRLGHVRPEDALPGRWVLVTIGLLNVSFLIAVTAVLGSSGGLLESPLTGLKIALALPVIGALLTAFAIYVAARQWRSGAGTRGARIRYSAVTVTALLFVWSLGVWNLLGWRM